jgi:adenylate kinase
MTPIHVLTKNDFKFEEIKKILSNYGLLCNKIESLETVSGDCLVLREKTCLLRNNKIVKSKELKNLDRVIHYSELKVIRFEQSKKHTKIYESKVSGYININKRIDDKENVYNWDDIFVEIETLKTYQEMKESTLKFSARTKVISQFIEELITFESKIDLNHNPLNQENVLSFDGEINDLINNNKYLSIHKNNSLLKGLVSDVKNKGLFTRSAINKTQRNYWFPSLNAGLPLVPKKDEIHEITFMFHDLMHHTIPDLILSGEDSKLTRDTYIIHRMLSEAITIVLADMLFIDELVNSGIDYDWSKRKIYPIFKEFKKSGLSNERIKDLVWANVEFALLGNKKTLVELSNKEVVDAYDKKYSKFFIEDYRWTLNNYESMLRSKTALSSWYQEIKYYIPENRKITYYSADLTLDLSYEDKVKSIFEKTWSLLLENSKTRVRITKKEMNKNAFFNYMLGQSYLFFKYDIDSESKVFFNLLMNDLKSLNDFNKEEEDRIKGFLNLYVERLNNKNLISETEMKTFKEIVPLFETFFVFYDKDLMFNSVSEIVEKKIK